MLSLMSLLTRILIPSEQGVILMTTFNHHYFLRDPHLQIQPHWGSVSTYRVGGTTIQSVTVTGNLVSQFDFRLECENHI